MPPESPIYEFGDVVVVPFPFTDQSAAKKRPAIVVSSRGYNTARADVILLAVTSQEGMPGEYNGIPIAAWREAGLLKPSVCKPVLMTVLKSKLSQRLGALQGNDRTEIRKMLGRMIG